MISLLAYGVSRERGEHVHLAPISCHKPRSMSDKGDVAYDFVLEVYGFFSHFGWLAVMKRINKF